MKVADSDGRAVLVLGDEVADVETASGGEFGPDPMSLYERWTDVADFGTTVTAGPGQALESWVEGIGTIRNPCTQATR